MSDLQQRLAEDLHRVAGDLDVPPPPLGALQAAGRRRLRHRRTALVATVAAVVAVIAGVGLGASVLTSSAPVQPLRQGRAPHSVPEAPHQTVLPTGPAPTVAYWHNGTVYTPQGAVPTAASDVYAAGATVLVGLRHAPEGTYTWWQVTDGVARPAPIPAGVVSPHLSPDGHLVVWEEIHPKVTRVRAWDPATSRVLAWKDVWVTQGCCGGPVLMLYGVDNAGQAYYGDGNALVVWDTRTNTAHTVTGLGGLPPQPDRVTATGIVLQGNPASLSEAPGVYGTVDASGAFHRTGTVPWSMGAWSPDGTLMEYPGDYGQFVLKAPQTTEMVFDPATGKTVRMRFPRGYLGYVGWESNDALLVQMRTGPYAHDVLRCQVATGSCEIALRGNTDQWRFPVQ